MRLREKIEVYMQDLVHYGDPEVFGVTAPEPSMTVLAEKAAIAFEDELASPICGLDEDDLDQLAFEVFEWWDSEG